MPCRVAHNQTATTGDVIRHPPVASGVTIQVFNLFLSPWKSPRRHSSAPADIPPYSRGMQPVIKRL
jgi:hypothetical protein